MTYLYFQAILHNIEHGGCLICCTV